jgi:nucleoside transporter|tara:strand:+ start:2037 stop:3245 length:1209 start_codon:yes stop_codon:yes gene_type:complete
MNGPIKSKLSIMMFLEFFIWGCWFVTMGTFLSQAFSSSGSQISLAYSTQSWGAIISPFIIGLIADRYFDAEKVLAIIHIIGGGLLFMCSIALGFEKFYPYILIYMILYMPTLALVNSIAFRQMKDPSKQFPKVRVWGTIGWIVAGLVISYGVGWETDKTLEYTFYLAAIVSILLGLFSFSLPKTPPKTNNESTSISEILGLDALKLLIDTRYLVFFLSSILICIPLAFYYQDANLFLNELGMSNAAGVMTLGQISEALFILLLPLFLNKYGIKKTLIVGMLAWSLRYVLFAFGDTGSNLWMLIFGIVLHGICYDFFFVSGQIYTDFKAGEKYKSSAQGLIALATYGVGMLIGFKMAGIITDKYALEIGHNWKEIWTYPAIFAAVVLVIFILTFKNEKIIVKK